MAKQTGEVRITGAIDGTSFYKMDGRYYARAKSSLDGNRVKKDKRFRRTMENAKQLAIASKLASHVYQQLPDNLKKHEAYRKLTGMAIRLLRESNTPENIIVMLNAAANNTIKDPTKIIA